MPVAGFGFRIATAYYCLDYCARFRKHNYILYNKFPLHILPSEVELYMSILIVMEACRVRENSLTDGAY